MTTKTRAPIRIGIAGLGFGAAVHLPAFRSLADVEVVAMLGTDSSRARQSAGILKIPVFTNASAFFDVGLDALSIAVPPQAVEALVDHALERNLGILCEKPLGPDLITAETLLRRAQGRTSAMGFIFAEMETFRALCDVVSSRRIGNIQSVDVSWLTRSRIKEAGGRSWKTDASQKGGVLTLLGSHVLFLAETLLGPSDRLVARCTTSTSNDAERIAKDEAALAEDMVHLLMQHRCGAMFSSTISNAAGIHVGHRWTVVGDEGVALLENMTLDPVTGFELTVRDKAGSVVLHLKEKAAASDGRIGPFTKIASRFVEALRRDEVCWPGFREGVRVNLLIDAAKKSSAAGKWLDL